MLKLLFMSALLCVMIPTKGLSQSSTQPPVSNTLYHPSSADKESWQRLNLLLSATYFRVVKESEVDFDSCLLYVSRSLGLSRLSLLAEGIDDPGLPAQAQWIDQRDPNKAIRFLSQARGKKHLELLVLLGAYYAFQPQSSYHRDSVEYFLTKAIDESKVIKEASLGRQALCLLGKMYLKSDDRQHGDSVFSRLINECQLAGDKETEARAFVYWGLYPAYTPATTQNSMTYFLTHFQKAAEIYHELNNIEGEINAVMDIGYLLVATFQLQKAYDAFLKALQLEKTINYPYIQYNTDALAMVTEFQGRFGEPLKYTLETVKIAETTRDSIGWAYFYDRLGALYQIEGQRDEESLKWYLKALDRFVMADDANVYQNLYNIISIMTAKGRAKEALDLVSSISKKILPRHPPDQIFYNMAFAVCYMGVKQYRLAEHYAGEADSIQKRSATVMGDYQKIMINALFGFIYFANDQFERSKKYLEQYFSFPSRERVLATEIAVYSRLIDIDSIFHDASSGVNHYKRYSQLIDSNFRVSKIRQEEELQVMYQTQEKENQIALLNQQTKLEQANLKQATLVKNLTIAGIVAVLIIAVLLYRQSSLRKKNNNVITHKNEQLQHLLTEKEWLLKEIHHRVKNNLQVVMSLLNSQSAYIDNDAALTAIHDSQHRVHAMALIHQKLYGSENVSSIDISVYVRELVSYLSDSFNAGQRIRFEYAIEPLEMDVSQAVPIGLILNEAITNSLKYAFPNKRNGIISISLSNTSPDHYLLSIADNGIGMPHNYINKKASSLGMSLMKGLSEDLDGNLSIENNNGTTIKISFVHNLGVKNRDTLAASHIPNN